MKIWFAVLLSLLFVSPAVVAGEADVVTVKVMKSPDNTFRFDVTVSHDDEGWEHYADKWDIVDPDGTVIGTRILYHPHVDEQSFTRSLAGVKIADTVTRVTVRAHDSVHRYGGREVVLDLP